MEGKAPVFSAKKALTRCFPSKESGDSNQPVKKNCLLGCSGSVATLKIPELAVELMKRDYNVLIVCSGKAYFFLEKAQAYNPSIWEEFQAMGGFDVLLQDADEWAMWEKLGNAVLHIELRKWADIFVVAPASASLLGKAACGISDNLVLNVMRAWDFKKPCYICPAMNTMMWEHPSTNEALSKLRSWGWQVIDPVDKVLACMEAGVGAMASVSSIVDSVINAASAYTTNIEPDILPASSSLKQPSTTNPSKKNQPNQRKIYPTADRAATILDGVWTGIGIGMGIGVVFLGTAILLIPLLVSIDERLEGVVSVSALVRRWVCDV
eukprot:gene3156-3455_t